MSKSYIIKTSKGYVKYSAKLADYNENAYFVGYSKFPESFFSSEYRAKLEAKICGIDNFEVIHV